MRVRMTTSMAGPNVRRLAGEEVEIDDAEAQRLIERGFADPVKQAAVEKAVDKRATEKAVTRKRKPAAKKATKKVAKKK